MSSNQLFKAIIALAPSPVETPHVPTDLDELNIPMGTTEASEQGIPDVISGRAPTPGLQRFFDLVAVVAYM